MFMCNPTPYFFFGVLTAALTPLHSAIATIKLPPKLIKIFLYIFFQFQLKNKVIWIGWIDYPKKQSARLL